MVRALSNKRYVIAFVLTLLIFTLGFLLGSVATESKFTELKDLQQDLRTQLASYDMQSLLLSQNTCKFNDVDTLIKELGTLADRLTAMENQLGKDNKDVIKLKEYYSLLEIRHWLFLKKLNQDCGTDYKLALFFYSSDEKTCPSCESQGYILSYFRARDEKLRIYSFDITIDNPALESLKVLYSIQTVPSIVLDDHLYSEYLTKEQLEEKLAQQNTHYLLK